MPRFLLTRITSGLGVLLLVCLFTFVVFFALSPDPAVQICGKNCTPEVIDQIRGNLGLDQPFWTQFFHFVVGIFAGRTYGEGAGAIECAAPCLGYSFQSSQAVWDMIIQRLPVSATIAVGAAVLWLLAGLAGGLLSAVKEGTFLDRFTTGLTLTSMSIPNYVLALVLQYVLVVQLQWLPFPQAVSFTDDPAQWFANFIMPWIVLAVGYAASYTRLTRANVLDVLRENYVRTAYAKGLAQPLVWRRHALRPALTPIVTIFGMDFAGLLGGALITETVFGINGVGKMAADSIARNDQPVIMGVTLLAGFLVVVGNIVVDVVYTAIDPRVRVNA
ncbi:ABC transporter permease [Promicromonospora sp. NPDC052451]|uniref:ABC transporter permease n=1 Tax=Promicromonospora sp. NPDC052451 TaxID=3364407 RepID=UPI0037CA224C